jgi:hypothetical protein
MTKLWPAGNRPRLLRLAVTTSQQVQWVLRHSKIAADYYQHIGWQKIKNSWFWPRKTEDSRTGTNSQPQSL